ncbi:MAG: hypothetical protein CL678_04330 [Bdellovibrionaceae bacterium]|nr:hypothetical protein [Pseudobdellovibrionaceae bacterium]
MTTSLPSSNCWANNKLLIKDNAIKLEIKEKPNTPSLEFNPTNPKIKFLPLPPLDYNDKLTYLLKNLEDLKNRKKQEKFQKWLREFSNNIQIKNIIDQLICDVKSLIKNKEFSITDENELKNNIATFIYSISACQVKK